MIAEIVSNGMLSLPSSLAVVGIVPGVILIIFLGIFATYTSYLLVQFKLRHPDVHNMVRTFPLTTLESVRVLNGAGRCWLHPLWSYWP